MSFEIERERLRRCGFHRLVRLEPDLWIRPGPPLAFLPDPAACEFDLKGAQTHELIDFYRRDCGGFLTARNGRAETFGHPPQLVFPYFTGREDSARALDCILLAAGLGSLDPADLDLVLEFRPEYSWRLLHFLAAGSAAGQLLRSNPALGLLVGRFAEPEPPLPGADAVAQLLLRRRRDLAGVAGFPREERWVRILAKIPPATVCLSTLEALREAACCPGGDALAGRLGHLRRFEREFLEFLLKPVLRERCSDAFLRELELHSGLESLREVEGTLREIIAMEKRLPACPRYRTIESLHDLRRRWLQLDGALETWRKVERLKFPPPPLSPVKDYIEPIVGPRELYMEATRQRNCVLSYADSVADGTRYFYRCTRYFRATISVYLDKKTRRWRGETCAGFANQPVDALSRRLLFEYLGLEARKQSTQGFEGGPDKNPEPDSQGTLRFGT